MVRTIEINNEPDYKWLPDELRIGMWRLSFSDPNDGQEEAGRRIEKKWHQYEGAWDLLDG